MENEIQKKLGQRIQYLRKIKGYSQELFAEKIDIAVNTMSSIETGKAFMTSQTLQKILDVLDISPDELFTFSEDITNNDMYEYIINKLDFIKNDKDRLQIMYNVAKGIY